MDLQTMFDTVAQRTDDWHVDTDTNNTNSSLYMDFLTRHPIMSYAYLSVLGTITVMGNIANMLVLGSIISYKPLRTSGNLFIANLALADLCITAIADPFYFIGVVYGPRFFLDNVLLCHLLAGLCMATCTCSLWTIASVAVNRYVFICKHHIYQTVFSWKKTCFYCVVLWAIGIGMDIPNVTGWGSHTFDLKFMSCSFDRIIRTYTYFASAICIVTPLSIVCCCYFQIYQYATSIWNKFDGTSGNLGRKWHAQRSRQQEEFQLAKTLSTTCLVFFVCWTPFFIVVISDYNDTWSKIVYVITFQLAHMSSSSNSVIYAVLNRRFRDGYVHLLLCALRHRQAKKQMSRNKASGMKIFSTSG